MNELINLGNGQYVKITMLKGEKGSNIATITKTATSGLTDTYTITLTDGSTTTFNVTNGSSIDHITKTSTVGSVDTYTIYLTDGTVGGTFEVNNAVATIDQNFSESSTNPLMNKTLTNIIAGVENGSTASKTYYENDIILRNDSLYMVTTTVATGTAWADGVNISEKTLGELIGGLKASLTNFMFRDNNGVPEYSMDGGTTWNPLGGGSMQKNYYMICGAADSAANIVDQLIDISDFDDSDGVCIGIGQTGSASHQTTIGTLKSYTNYHDFATSNSGYTLQVKYENNLLHFRPKSNAAVLYVTFTVH